MARTTRSAAAEDTATRERLLTVALPLFAARGYDGVTMRQIAAAAGITAGSIYHHFASKEALYEAMLRRAYAGAAARWSRVLHSAAPPEERLRSYLYEFCLFVHDSPDFVRLMKREQLDADPRRMRLMAEALVAEQFYGTGELLAQLAPGIDPHEWTHTLLGAVLHRYETLPLRRLFRDYDPAQDDPERVAAHVCEVLMAGLRAVAAKTPKRA